MKKTVLIFLGLTTALAWATKEVDEVNNILSMQQFGLNANPEILKGKLFRAEQQALTLTDKIELHKKFLTMAQQHTAKLENDSATVLGTGLAAVGACTLLGMFLGTLIGSSSGSYNYYGHGGLYRDSSNTLTGLAIGTSLGCVCGFYAALLAAVSFYNQKSFAYRNEALIAKRRATLQLAELQGGSTLLP